MGKRRSPGPGVSPPSCVTDQAASAGASYSDGDRSPLGGVVRAVAGMSDLSSWPIFPFEGPLTLKPLLPAAESDPVRAGEPGGPACTACDRSDDAYLWTNDRWRVRPVEGKHAFPVVVFLESRDHLDLGDLDDELAADLGRTTVRLERAIRTVDGVGRVHIHHWGDGLAHLHLWFFARPLGVTQTLGAFSHVWDGLLPPNPPEVWERNLEQVANGLTLGDE